MLPAAAQPSAAPARRTAGRGRQALRRWTRRSLLALGILLILLGTAYAGLFFYLSWSEQQSPSTQLELVLKDGRRIPYLQPTLALPPAAPPAGDPVEQIAAGQPASQPPAYLAPERLRIPRIDLSWPVVLADNAHIPEFKAVGWLMGSAFPGLPGNMVLFGHMGGPHATFSRLHELQPGDEFSVETSATSHTYRVRSVFETTPDDVEVLLPADGHTVTLITCSGPWIPELQTNERRLIVSAELVE